jgi:TolB-like protein/Flp pilus assembly protein TadD
MSPEQAAGEAELDGRSDIYSLGAMLYEMLGGTAPFLGPTVQAIIAKLFADPAPPLRERHPGVPEWLEQSVMKSLAKTPAERYATAAQFAQALTQHTGTTPPGATLVSSGAQAAVVKSIAVLPFADMSPEHDQDYFCEGIAEEIINALTKIQALRVISRSSAFAFKGQNQDIRKVGEQLDVGTVLEGSIRKAGNRLRITAQLINVAGGHHLWSERYDRELEDVFAIQDEIAEAIVKALRVVLSPEEKRAIERAPTENVRAYEYYLRGRQYFHQFRRTGVQSARRMFERAIEVDPRFALAHAGLADSCAFLYMYWDGSQANLDGADTASRKALALDPELAEAHASRGFALSLRREYEAARPEFETAIRLNPKLYEAHYLYARACVQEGKMEDAVRHYEEAGRVRPEDFQAVLLVSGPLHGLGRHDEAIEAIKRGLQIAERHLELNPDDARALTLGAAALMELGQRERAMDWAGRAYAIDPTDPGVLYNVASVYALGGLRDEAVKCLQQAVDNGFGHREWLDNDTDLESLRDDPRFRELRDRI